MKMFGNMFISDKNTLIGFRISKYPVLYLGGSAQNNFRESIEKNKALFDLYNWGKNNWGKKEKNNV